MVFFWGGVAIVRDRMHTNGVSHNIIWTNVKGKRNVTEVYSCTSKSTIHKISRQLFPNYTVVSYVKIVLCKYTYNTVLAVVTETP